MAAETLFDITPEGPKVCPVTVEELGLESSSGDSLVPSNFLKAHRATMILPPLAATNGLPALERTTLGTLSKSTAHTEQAFAAYVDMLVSPTHRSLLRVTFTWREGGSASSRQAVEVKASLHLSPLTVRQWNIHEIANSQSADAPRSLGMTSDSKDWKDWHHGHLFLIKASTSFRRYNDTVNIFGCNINAFGPWASQIQHLKRFLSMQDQDVVLLCHNDGSFREEFDTFLESFQVQQKLDPTGLFLGQGASPQTPQNLSFKQDKARQLSERPRVEVPFLASFPHRDSYRVRFFEHCIYQYEDATSKRYQAAKVMIMDAPGYRNSSSFLISSRMTERSLTEETQFKPGTRVEVQFDEEHTWEGRVMERTFGTLGDILIQVFQPSCGDFHPEHEYTAPPLEAVVDCGSLKGIEDYRTLVSENSKAARRVKIRALRSLNGANRISNIARSMSKPGNDRCWAYIMSNAWAKIPTFQRAPLSYPQHDSSDGLIGMILKQLHPDAEQTTAIRRILGGKHCGFTNVQGAAGVGKTYLIKAMALWCTDVTVASNSTAAVWITSGTNVRVSSTMAWVKKFLGDKPTASGRPPLIIRALDLGAEKDMFWSLNSGAIEKRRANHVERFFEQDVDQTSMQAYGAKMFQAVRAYEQALTDGKRQDSRIEDPDTCLGVQVARVIGLFEPGNAWDYSAELRKKCPHWFLFLMGNWDKMERGERLSEEEEETLDDSLTHAIYFTLDKADVVGASLSAISAAPLSGERDMSQRGHNDCSRPMFLVIDEASRFLEPDIVSAMFNFADHSEIVMMGDLHQNGPFNMCRRMHPSVAQFNTSFFERTILSGAPTITLRDQKRSPQAMVQHVSSHFYRAQDLRVPENDPEARHEAIRLFQRIPAFFNIEGHPSAHGKLPLVLLIIPKGSSRVLHIPTTPSKANDTSMAVSIKAAKLAIDMGFCTRSDNGAHKIGIITAYDLQRSNYEKVLPSFNASCGEQDLKVETMDSAQGSELSVAIIDTVALSDPGFLRNPRRMTTALTRARHGIILVIACELIDAIHTRRIGYNALDSFLQHGAEHFSTTLTQTFLKEASDDLKKLRQAT